MSTTQPADPDVLDSSRSGATPGHLGTALVAIVVALAVAVGLSTEVRRPATRHAAPVANAVPAAATADAARPYDAMQDYVDTLLYWHRNPNWLPAGCRS